MITIILVCIGLVFIPRITLGVILINIGGIGFTVAGIISIILGLYAGAVEISQNG